MEEGSTDRVFRIVESQQGKAGHIDAPSAGNEDRKLHLPGRPQSDREGSDAERDRQGSVQTRVH